jgi:hypothetical protein
MNAVQKPPAFHEILCLRFKNSRYIVSEDFVDIAVKEYSDLVLYFDSVKNAKISQEKLAQEYLKAGLREPEFELVRMDKAGEIVWIKDLELVGEKK